MENIEKDLGNVAGGEVVESKDGKFFVTGEVSVYDKHKRFGNKLIESKDGRFFLIDYIDSQWDDTVKLNNKELALKICELANK